MRALIGSLLLTTLGASISLAQPPRYQVTDIGSLVGMTTLATALNDRGQVVGSSIVGDAGPHAGSLAHAFLYFEGVMTDLFPSDIGEVSLATGINEAGVVVGYRRWFATGPAEAFRYLPGAAGAEFLNPFGLPPFAATGQAWGINESGQTVGGAGGLTFLSHPFLWSPGPPPLGVDLTPDLQFPYFAGSASAINDRGDVVGTLTRAGGGFDSFLYDGVVLHTDLDLPLQALYPGASFEPKAINGGGLIVGDARRDPEPPRAVLFANGSFQDLGTLGGEISRAFGIDSAGRVVGASPPSSGAPTHAFLWENGVLYDLNEFIPSGAGIVLAEAVAINDEGAIAANGYPAGTFPPLRWHSFLLTPLDPESIIGDVIDFIDGLDLPKGIENSLLVKLRNALAALEAGDTAAACGLLQAFLNEVNAQAGKKIPLPDAIRAIEMANEARAALGCG